MRHFAYSAAIQLFFFLANTQYFSTIPILTNLISTTSRTTSLGGGRNVGSIGDYELVAEFLTLGLVASVSLLLHTKNTLNNKKYLIMTIISILICGFMTVTRSFFIISAIGLLISALISRNKIHTWLKLFLLTILLGSITVLIIPNYLINRNIDRMQGIEVTGDNAFNRAPLYRRGAEMIPEAGIFGYGSSYSSILSPLSDTASTHSLYLDTVLITGYLGALLLLFMIIRTLTYIIKYATIAKRKLYVESPVFKITSIMILIWYLNESKINATREYTYFSLMGMLFALNASSYIHRRLWRNGKPVILIDSIPKR